MNSAIVSCTVEPKPGRTAVVSVIVANKRILARVQLSLLQLQEPLKSLVECHLPAGSWRLDAYRLKKRLPARSTRPSRLDRCVSPYLERNSVDNGQTALEGTALKRACSVHACD